MTITSTDRTTAKTQMGDFGAQDDLTADLPNVIQNMLREFADRDGIPNDITISERRARKICNHESIGCYTLDISARLTAELSDFPFQAFYEDGLEMNNLEEIVDDINSSFPIVQVSSSYYEQCEGYKTQTDSRGGGKDLYLLVMNVNHDEVLLYDPYRFRGEQEGKMTPTQIGKKPFKSAWQGKFEITSTLWVESTDQRRISQFIS